MANGGHRERILALLKEFPLNDDEIAARLAIEPRQTVNQICRRLAGQGLLSRQPGPGGKIVNVLSGQSVTQSENAARSSELAESPRASGISLAPDDFARTLIVIPCSGRKRSASGSQTPQADTILHHLPADIAGELAYRRASVKSKLPFDEAHLVPAWQRYDGALYQLARSALGNLIETGAHIIILSGGYGPYSRTSGLACMTHR